MLAFHADGDGGDPRADDFELSDVRWFRRNEVEAAAAGRGVVFLPPPFTIARRLIDGWLATAQRSGRSG